MDPVRPSLDLLRALTDEHVLRALLQHPRLTRAELATDTGISKPTIGESVRRLTEAGVLIDTGERTPGGRGRGRVGSYYALAGDVGTALVVSIAPAGVVAESIDAYGGVVTRSERAIERPAAPEQVAAAIRATAGEVGARPRLAVVSAADPVDRATGRLVHLPDAPFLLGELDPVEILAAYVDGPVSVDNDVNWAARAEQSPGGPEDFAYLFLDEGLGCAIVSDGEIRRGRTGLAGEVSHLITVGPHGRAVRLIEVFGELGLRCPGSTAIDVDRLLSQAIPEKAAKVAQRPEKQETTAGTASEFRAVLGRAVSGVLAALVALSDPELIVIGGQWGREPLILEAIGSAFAQLPRHVPVRAAQLTAGAALAGARLDAVERLRTAIIGDARRSSSGGQG
jgi:predicted NBD/HSP70 family sugar kinase